MIEKREVFSNRYSAYKFYDSLTTENKKIKYSMLYRDWEVTYYE